MPLIFSAEVDLQGLDSCFSEAEIWSVIRELPSEKSPGPDGSLASPWRDWISAILSTTSTKVLLNGSPGRCISHRMGLRQEDPLSPLLFVLVMEALNGLFLRAESDGFFELVGLEEIPCWASLYADDLVIFVKPMRRDILVLRSVLQIPKAVEQALVDKVGQQILSGKVGSLTSLVAQPWSPWAIQAIDKLRRAFLWSGSDTVIPGKWKIAWTVVCRPLEFGGLGVVNLNFLGLALRVRWH
ncbi:hypothetical protein U9M48_006718 [Paspalum notatum var. saurae]|uniref:Reverse transcriptase domain-containing protein n=1 Tax=Paspalum notatum var. saurae TaxID=547442 RepID=A0AAQ3SKS4_PASNO